MDFKRLKYIYKLIGLALIPASVLMIFGWLFQWIFMVRVIPNAPPILFNTALCFCLSGLSLLLYSEKKSSVFTVLIWAISLLPCLRLIEYFSDLSIGVDQIFTIINSDNVRQYKMAPETAVSFMLFSLFLYLSQKTFKRFHFLMILPGIWGILGLINIVGYVLDTDQVSLWGILTQMPILTAMGFLLLAIASCLLLLSNTQLSDLQLDTLLDYAVFLSTVFFFLMLWLVVRVNYINTIKHEVEDQLDVINAKLSVEIERDIEAIIRLFSRYSSKSYSNPHAFDQDVDYYFKDMSFLESLSFDNRGDTVTFTNPLSKDNKVSGNKLCPILSKLTSIQWLPVISGQSGYLCIQNNEAAAAINLKQIITQISQQNQWRFMISLQQNGKIFYQGTINNKTYERFWGKTEHMAIYGHNWSLTVTPTAEYVKKSIGRIPLLIFILAASISFLILFLLRYRRRLIVQKKALLSAEAVKTSVLNSTVEGMLGVNHSLKIYFMNQSAQKLLDVTHVPDKDIFLNHLITTSNSEDNIIRNVKKTLLSGDSIKKETEITLINDDKTISVSYSSSPIMEQGVISGAIIVFSDNTQRKIYEEELKKLALYDSLTQLPNRFRLITHLQEVIVRAQRHQIPFSLCFIDIDNFKAINDNYGHHIGDKALQYVANIITHVIRSNDFFGRLSGDEFCLIMEGINSEEDIDKVLVKIYKALETPMTFEHGALRISLSIGSISYSDEATPEELLNKADKLMYAKKKNNKLI